MLCLNAPRLMGHSAQGTDREPPSSFSAPAGKPPSPAAAHRGGRICDCGTPAAARSSSYVLHGQHSHSPARQGCIALNPCGMFITDRVGKAGDYTFGGRFIGET